MQTERIPVRVTQTGQMMDVVVFETRASHITVVIGECMHTGGHSKGPDPVDF
ncbi:MAG: hypothetical protein WCA45_07000 [Thiobacillaceae bacterium]